MRNSITVDVGSKLKGKVDRFANKLGINRSIAVRRLLTGGLDIEAEFERIRNLDRIQRRASPAIRRLSKSALRAEASPGSP
jgi:hypothetical protein